ncbi:hypothetical protein B834_2719 [Enterococcus mundtii 1A]|nr:hypothetical protein [Enterococcus mundtii 1A]
MNEKLKYDPSHLEQIEKVKSLHGEKKELEKQVKLLEKQLKTYDAALSILTEKVVSDSVDLGK